MELLALGVLFALDVHPILPLLVEVNRTDVASDYVENSFPGQSAGDVAYESFGDGIRRAVTHRLQGAVGRAVSVFTHIGHSLDLRLIGQIGSPQRLLVPLPFQMLSELFLRIELERAVFAVPRFVKGRLSTVRFRGAGGRGVFGGFTK